MIPFPNNQKLVTWYATTVWNVTGLLRQLQGKIENIYLFKVIKNMEMSLALPKIGGAATPLAPPPPPPSPYANVNNHDFLAQHFIAKRTPYTCTCTIGFLKKLESNLSGILS